MLQRLKKVLASTQSDAQKISEIRQLLDSCLETSQVYDLLVNALGKAQFRMPWDKMTGDEMIALLRASSVPEFEYDDLKEDDTEAIRGCLNNWATSINLDPGLHFPTASKLGKKINSIRQGYFTKPDSLLAILKEAGLCQQFTTTFVLEDTFEPNEAVTIDGNLARLVSKPNLFQWWAEVVIDSKKEIRLVEIRDIQKL